MLSAVEASKCDLLGSSAAPQLPVETARENDRVVVLRGCLHFVQYLNSFIFAGTKCQKLSPESREASNDAGHMTLPGEFCDRIPLVWACAVPIEEALADRAQRFGLL